MGLLSLFGTILSIIISAGVVWKMMTHGKVVRALETNHIKHLQDDVKKISDRLDKIDVESENEDVKLWTIVNKIDKRLIRVETMCEKNHKD